MSHKGGLKNDDIYRRNDRTTARLHDRTTARLHDCTTARLITDVVLFFIHTLLFLQPQKAIPISLKTISYIFAFVLFNTCLQLEAQVQIQPVEVKRTQEKTIINNRIFYIHTVLKGQTLYSISKAYEVSQDVIIRENPGLDATTLKEGQAIRIPAGEEKQAAVYPQNKEDFHEHRVRRRQTVYSLARKYNVDEELIYHYNPWARQGIQPDQTLWIPRREMQVLTTRDETQSGFFYHTVKDQETLYSISLVYGVMVSDIVDNNDFLKNGLKAGQVLKIPKVQAPNPAEAIATDSVTDESKPCMPANNENVTYNVGLLLPFYAQYSTEETTIPIDTVAEDGTYVPSQRQQGLRGRSFAEFYEGFLLALDSLKNTGLSVSLHVYDTEHDTMKVKKIVRELSSDQPDLIIGPVYTEDVSIASRLARYQEFNLVSPLSSRASLVSHNPRVFQVIPSMQAQCESLANYLSQFTKGSLMLIRGTDSISMRDSWIFKKYLLEHMPVDITNQPLAFHDYKLNDSLMMKLDKVMSQQEENIIIVFSESEPDVSRLISNLYRMSTLYPLKLFGLPSWQAWKTIDLNYFHSLQLHLISPFFIDYNSPRVNRFLNKCRMVYGYEPYEISARGYNFCMLGYDLGLYFLSALKLYGKDFQQCLENMDSGVLLSPYRFVRDGEGGYVNSGFNMIQYNPDFTITNSLLKK
jgi:LysM repeat protein/ABC-type branched-subunit amino acid transport system substrate-binding protein